ncbi:MAG: hypothetical protein M1299_12695 [Firmicutes bacterium]|nr:hypothetical protein [Bacillota bacterium]MCL5040650.1 hypothetical protein [Bacillota bacterium]
MAIAPMQTRDLGLIMALRPYVSPPAQKVIDTFLELVELQAEAGPDVFDPAWLKNHAREMAISALPLGLLYVPMVLSQGLTKRKGGTA